MTSTDGLPSRVQQTTVTVMLSSIHNRLVRSAEAVTTADGRKPLSTMLVFFEARMSNSRATSLTEGNDGKESDRTGQQRHSSSTKSSNQSLYSG